jgi:predicted nucleic acid-binding protein
MSADRPAKFFLDTNIVTYALITSDSRQATAESLLADATISVQVLNELVSIAMRKYRLGWEQINYELRVLKTLCASILPLTQQVHELAVELAERYGFYIYDANIIAAALVAGCDTLYSEDMQDGQRIGPLTIRNPFTSAEQPA